MTKKKIFIVLFIILLTMLLAGAFFLWVHFSSKPAAPVAVYSSQSNNQKNDIVQPDAASPSQDLGDQANSSATNASGFRPSLSRADERVTKKPFGKFITPQNSPIQPEKFRGYHTGADFEIFPVELNVDVPVQAICDGKLLMKKYATGYGGVAVESCTLSGAPITVVYGHLKLDSISKKVGEKISAGDTLGILGADKSAETDGERKHLHLGMHKGAGVNILGYVSKEASLVSWIDPCIYICQK